MGHARSLLASTTSLNAVHLLGGVAASPPPLDSQVLLGTSSAPYLGGGVDGAVEVCLFSTSLASSPCNRSQDASNRIKQSSFVLR
jgi:hypothetical protein